MRYLCELQNYEEDYCFFLELDKLTFKYNWTNHLSKKSQKMCTCGEKNIKQQQ